MGVVSAVDRLLKVNFILNMEYALQYKHILHFLEHSVTELADNMPLSRSRSCVNLCNKKMTKLICNVLVYGTMICILCSVFEYRLCGLHTDL